MKVYKSEDLYGAENRGRVKNGLLSSMILDIIMESGGPIHIRDIQVKLERKGIYSFRYRNEMAFRNSIGHQLKGMIESGIIAKQRKTKETKSTFYGLPEDFN